MNTNETILPVDEAEVRESESSVPNKRKAVGAPDGDIGILELSEIIDTEVLQSIMEEFYRLTGMLGAVLDLSGNILVAVGWQDICTKFHRCHPDTLKNCIESDTILTAGVPEGTFKAYRCKNNMWDMVTPLMVGGRHIGNVFIGQFFYEDETPDVEWFRQQARQCGFDEKEYLAALEQVPHFSRETVDAGMRFYSKLAGLVSTLSFSMIQQSRMLAERKQAEDRVAQLHAELQRHAEELEQRVIERTAELAVARDYAEEANRTKSAFLATMSHELRTPLNSIIGFTGLILQGLAGPLNTEQAKQLGMVKDSGQHLLALINDILDISKIEAGHIQIANKPFDLRESIQKIMKTVTPLADKKQLPLTVRMTPGVGPITSDRRRVEQILLNLLSNAIKFTERGEVALTAELLAESAGDQVNRERSPMVRAAASIRNPKSEIRISVADTGIGMKPEDLDKLFTPFRQLDSGLTRQHEGTGLGLAICKRLVERLDGTITVESQWGKGSTFTFTLPINTERES